MLHLDQLERHVMVAQLVAGQAMAAGAEGVDMPDWESVRASFDESLREEPTIDDPDTFELKRALGVG